MKLSFQFLIFFTFIAIVYSSRDRNNQKYKVVCYWGSWSFYRPGDGKFAAEDANPNICTHMIYGFTKLNPDNKIAVFDPDLDTGDKNSDQWGEGMYARFNHLRTVNPNMTTIIAIGGWNEGSTKYSKMVSSVASRKTFVQSVVQFLQKYDFDGFDVDWEYPAMKAEGQGDRTPGNAADKENYIALLKELKDAFTPHGFILTSAVSAGKSTIDKAYNVKEVNKYLDIINIMTYDFHGPWDMKTGHNAPLHPKPNDSEEDIEFTIEYAINYWIKLGADPKKMVLGMPLYGHSFTLKGTDSGIHAESIGDGGAVGKFTEEKGMLGYNEICELLKEGQWTVKRDEVQKVPYAFKGNQWVSYDDVASIKDKVAFLKSKGLGGGMVWSIDTDDFKGKCGLGKYPLLKAISGELNGITGPDPVIVEPNFTKSPKPSKATVGSTQPHKATTKIHINSDATTKAHVVTDHTVTPSGVFKCESSGWFKDPIDPMKFHDCEDMGDGKLTNFEYHCGKGTVYDEVNHVCKLP